MKDALIKQLNDRLAKEVKARSPQGNQRVSSGMSKFDQVFTSQATNPNNAMTDLLGKMIDKVDDRLLLQSII